MVHKISINHEKRQKPVEIFTTSYDSVKIYNFTFNCEILKFTTVIKLLETVCLSNLSQKRLIDEKCFVEIIY